jgi:multidrug resistance efflux pump
MSAASFRSVFMVASCAGAALGCYLVSLRVASERAALEDVETKIVLAQRDIRVLQTEIGTHEASLKTAPREKAEISLEPRPARRETLATEHAGTLPEALSQKATRNAANAKGAPKPLAAKSNSAPAKAQARMSTSAKASAKPKGDAQVKGGSAELPKSKTAKSSVRDLLAPVPGTLSKSAGANKSTSKPPRESTSKQ